VGGPLDHTVDTYLPDKVKKNKFVKEIFLKLIAQTNQQKKRGKILEKGLKINYSKKIPLFLRR